MTTSSMPTSLSAPTANLKPEIPKLNIPTPPTIPGHTPEFDEAFKEGFQFGYTAGIRDSIPPLDNGMKQRANEALYAKIYGEEWDGENLRMIGIRDYVAVVLEAALSKPKKK